MRTRIKSRSIVHLGVAIGVWIVLVGSHFPLTANAQIPTNNLTLWLDASSITGLTDGSTVAAWSNKVLSVPHHFTQSTVGLRPLYKTNVVNGLPAVRFDGSDDRLGSSSVTNFFTTTAYTIFSVFSADAISTDVSASYQNDMIIGDNSGFLGQYLKGTNAVAYNWDGQDDRVLRPVKTNSWNILESGLGSGSLFIKLNTQPLVSTNSGPNTIGAVRTMAVGGNPTAFNNWFDGDLAEILVYNRTLSPFELEWVGDYLSTKYAVAVPEPSALSFLAVGALLLWRRRGTRQTES